jgi:hypothetical protein
MKLKSLASILLKVILPVTVGLVVLVAIIAALSGMFTEKIAPGRTGDMVRQTMPNGASTDTVLERVQPYLAEAI